MNIGAACTTEQCRRGLAHKPAMRWIDPLGNGSDYTFADLDNESNRFANILTALGIGKGDVFFIFVPKSPELFFAFLGCLKAQAICAPLFANFGEDALFDRLHDAGAAGLMTTKALYGKIARIRERLPTLRQVILVDGGDDPPVGTSSYNVLSAVARIDFDVPSTPASTSSVLHYTSGSTGKPKGVLHCHGSLASQMATAQKILQLSGDDVFWCTADQGWVTGTSYGVIAPWSLGITQLHYGGGYDAKTWVKLLAEEKVTVWYSAPTAFRMMMREDDSLYTSTALGALRHIYSVGEPLNPEIISWARRVFSHEIYDTWFQTETGAIMIANRPGLNIRPGSMGRPVDGIEATILSEDGLPLPDGVQGDLCVKAGWPSMFVSYLNNQQAYEKRFRNGWYYTGDIVRRDAEGYFWFVGRSDDVINTAGHLVSPFEVENVLLELGEVTESGVIGVPDELLYEKVVAFVCLREGVQQSKDLELKLRLYVSNRLSSIAAPQEVVFTGSVPKNKSGKIMRRVLKSSYLGEPAGDLSTLENL